MSFFFLPLWSLILYPLKGNKAEFSFPHIDNLDLIRGCHQKRYLSKFLHSETTRGHWHRMLVRAFTLKKSFISLKCYQFQARKHSHISGNPSKWHIKQLQIMLFGGSVADYEGFCELLEKLVDLRKWFRYHRNEWKLNSVFFFILSFVGPST